MTVPINPAAATAQAVHVAAGDYRASFRKTIYLAGVAVLGCVTVMIGLSVFITTRFHDAGILFGGAVALVVFAGAALAAWLCAVCAGGALALHRDRLESVGLPYAAPAREAAANALIPSIVSLFRRRRRPGVLGLRPGERVVVRDLPEILATLDASGMLDDTPFMPEMTAFCGQPATVFRRVDKLNDWIHSAGLKRVRDTVQLEMRCDGAGHGGCQANCRIRWKEAWLRRPGQADRVDDSAPSAKEQVEPNLYQLSRRATDAGEVRYVCQATMLAANGTPMVGADPRHFIRDLVSGNVRFRPWIVGISIACFNWVQTRRGGALFPQLGQLALKTSPTVSLDLRPGQVVTVKPKVRIGETLNSRNRNRGLSFDLEMLRFCGGRYTVRSVLSRVIIERTGELKDLAMPSIILEGVRATGEYRAFNPEDEHIFWREIWLERVTDAS